MLLNGLLGPTGQRVGRQAPYTPCTWIERREPGLLCLPHHVISPSFDATSATHANAIVRYARQRRRLTTAFERSLTLVQFTTI